MSGAPSLTSASLWNCTRFSFLHFLNFFSFWGGMCAASRSDVAPGGNTGAHRPRGNSRASSGCWAQGPLKGWNETRGEYVPPFLSNQKALSSGKITLHYAAPPKRHKFQNTTQQMWSAVLLLLLHHHLLALSISIRGGFTPSSIQA